MKRQLTAARYERLIIGARLFDLSVESKIPISTLSLAERSIGAPLSPEREKARRRALERLKARAGAPTPYARKEKESK